MEVIDLLQKLNCWTVARDEFSGIVTWKDETMATSVRPAKMQSLRSFENASATNETNAIPCWPIEKDYMWSFWTFHCHSRAKLNQTMHLPGQIKTICTILSHQDVDLGLSRSFPQCGEGNSLQIITHLIKDNLYHCKASEKLVIKFNAFLLQFRKSQWQYLENHHLFAFKCWIDSKWLLSWGCDRIKDEVTQKEKIND